MIPMSAMKYYLDPTRPAAGDTEYGYVIDSLRPAYDGTFVKLKKSVRLDSGRLRSITLEGNYVDAVPANRPFPREFVVGLLGAPDAEHTRFGVGLVRSFHEDAIMAGSVLFSDGTRTPQIDGAGGMRAPFRTWLPAAPWAAELMPEPGDTQEIVDAKVEVARLRWTELYRLQRLDAEGNTRDSQDDLDGLREKHDWIPRFTYSPLVNATVQLTEMDPNPVASDTLRARISSLQEAGLPVFGMVARPVRSIPVRAEVAVPAHTQEWADITDPGLHDVKARILTAFGDDDLQVSSYTSNWFLNGMAVQD